MRAEAMKMRAGDVYLTNNPYRGGSHHLPDMTVVCPIFSESGKLLFFTASRGHHADIGGSTPGSMPPVAAHIDEEGILIDGFLLVRDGEFREGELTGILTNHRYPVRNLPERIYDVKAQIAACRKGERGLIDIVGRYGWNVVERYMEFIQEKRGLCGCSRPCFVLSERRGVLRHPLRITLTTERPSGQRLRLRGETIRRRALKV